MNALRRRACHRGWAALLALGLLAPAFSAEPAAPASLPSLSLNDLFAEEGAADIAVAPSGKYLAVVLRRSNEDMVVIQDLASGDHQPIALVGRKEVGPKFDARIEAVYWKNDDRLLFRLMVVPARGVSWEKLQLVDIRRMGTRLLAIDRTGKNLVRLLGKNDNYELDWAMDLGAIRSMLPHDPEHILMVIDGEDGRSLFKVNVRTGVGEVVEHAGLSVWDWWLDLEGQPVVRVDVSRGRLRFYRREEDGKWKKFHSVRLRELKEQNEYEPLGPSDQPGKYYVLARPEGAQRHGVYLYDLEKEEFGTPVAEHPQYDIFSAFIARDGTRVQHYCYLAHVQVCEVADAKVNAHMRGIRKYFKDSANVELVDASADSQTMALFVEGPSDPPAYYQYQVARRQIEFVGLTQEAMNQKALPTAAVVEYAARDGLKLTGYLTRPPGSGDESPLPLVMMPHGGPEARDHLTFDLYVQYLAAQGYAVFQPNFRGSDGFGRTFADSGHGEWGRKMQDDISDALAMLVERKIVDPRRVCIVGASYGGYAALAGITLTPDLYQCAVSIAGPGNLAEFLKAQRKKHGADSDVYAYWISQVGDPERDAVRIAAASPVYHVDQVKAPVLLVHGEDDEIVPFAQSKEMKAVLDKSGRKTELITLKDEGHSGWSEGNERRTLEAISKFLAEHIGPKAARPGE